MPAKEWTTSAEKLWLQDRIRNEYLQLTDQARTEWCRKVVSDFIETFPKEKRALNGVLESDAEVDERWDMVPNVRILVLLCTVSLLIHSHRGSRNGSRTTASALFTISHLRAPIGRPMESARPRCARGRSAPAMSSSNATDPLLPNFGN